MTTLLQLGVYLALIKETTPHEISGKCSIPFFSLPMFTQAGNVGTTTGTLECLTAVHPTIKTVGNGPV